MQFIKQHSTIPTHNQPLLATLICFDSHLSTSTIFSSLVLSYINPHSTMPIYTLSYTDQLLTILEQYRTILNNTYLHWTSNYKLFSAFLTHTQLHQTATVSYLLLMVTDLFSLYVLFRFCFPISDHMILTQRTRFLWNVVLCTCISVHMYA